MKCKDCTMDCGYRTSDAEKECEFQNRIIQVPDEWLNSVVDEDGEFETREEALAYVEQLKKRYLNYE